MTANEKLVRILRAKSAFSEAEVDAMADVDGWAWVYANAKPAKEKLTQVCFTGFSTEDKARLVAMAEGARIEVVTTVTKNLAFLCVGPNAGPAKLDKARGQGAHVMTAIDFEHLVASGEIRGSNVQSG